MRYRAAKYLCIQYERARRSQSRVAQSKRLAISRHRNSRAALKRRRRAIQIGDIKAPGVRGFAGGRCYMALGGLSADLCPAFPDSLQQAFTLRKSVVGLVEIGFQKDSLHVR